MRQGQHLASTSPILHLLIGESKLFEITTEDTFQKISVKRKQYDSNKESKYFKMNKVSSDEEDHLINLSLTPDKDHRWNLMFKALLDYGAIHASYNCHIDTTFNQANGIILRVGAWLSIQRQMMRKGKLSPYHQAKLQELVDTGRLHWIRPSVSTIGDVKWNIPLELLGEFGNTNNINTPSLHINTPPDGSRKRIGNLEDK